MLIKNNSNTANEHGSVLVLTVIILPVAVLLLAIAVNIGLMVSAKNQAQSAVDAAALAAVAGLPHYNLTSTDTKIHSLASAFNGSNQSAGANSTLSGNLDISSSDIQILTYNQGTFSTPVNPSEANAVQITKDFQVPMLLQNLVNTGSWSFRVSGAAVLGGPGCFQPIMPFALVDCSNIESNGFCDATTCGTEVILSMKRLEQANSAAFFFYSGSQANAVNCRNMVNNNNPNLCSGELVQLNNGVIANCLRDISDACDDVGCSTASPWVIDAPLISCESLSAGNNNANQSAPISGFARIGITEVNTRDKYIRVILYCGEETPVAVGGGKNCGLYAAGPVLVN